MLTRRDCLAIPPTLLVASACGRAPSAAEPAHSRGQPLSNLYQCEGCEGALERDAAKLDWQTRVAAPQEQGEAFVYEGTVYSADTRQPTPGIVIYAYQTNAAGFYADGTTETEWSRRHGNLRGWTKTSTDGRYRFLSIKPGPYPDANLPAHVHLTVLEPGRPPYWIDDIVFAGEFGVTREYRSSMANKGGDGIVDLARDLEQRWIARRDIILERHPA